MGYKIKRILVGTQQVRPKPIYQYGINFKDYSNISQVQALGWTFDGADTYVVPAVNQTYGFHNSNYQTNVWWFRGYKSIPSLANASKVTISMSGYGPSSASNAAYEFINLANSSGTYLDAGLGGFFRFGNGGSTDKIYLSTDSSTIWSQDIGSGASYSGQFTLTIEIDFVNKLATYTSTGKALSGSHALSDSDITYIKTLDTLKVQATAYNYSAINNQIWTASIKVEY